MHSADRELPLRVTLRRPPAGVRFALQRGKADAAGNAELVGGQVADGVSDLRFDWTVRVRQTASAAPQFLGPFTQGPPVARFVYITVGRRAGQAESPWDRRVKVPLTEITLALIAQTLERPGAVLEAALEGTLADGSPICATRPFVSGGWQIRPATSSVD